MGWVIEKKVIYHNLDLEFESVGIPIRVKFEFEVRDGAIVLDSLTFEHLFNKNALLKRYPDLNSERLELDIYETVKLQIRKYLLNNEYLKEDNSPEDAV
ncbi:MAG: hypothetical protein JSV83_10950 [Desulfobacterales bacterium]|nr:MAG: hypothetical protein JSV83_10950 [Desulfobacterales bacterium]